MTKPIEQIQQEFFANKFPLTLDLQFFARDGDGGDDDNDGQDQDDDQSGSGNDDPTNSLTEKELEEKMKNDPIFKAWYQKQFEKNFKQRTKKLRDADGNLIDPEEYQRLKKLEDDKRKANMTETEQLQEENQKLMKQIATVETKEKRLAVKEFALEKGYDAKLVARLMESELGKLKRNEDGEFEGIAESIDELANEFPQIKATQSNNDGDDNDDDQSGSSSYSAGGSQRTNPRKKSNPYNKGAELAKKRHAKQ